jgi:Recombinase
VIVLAEHHLRPLGGQASSIDARAIANAAHKVGADAHADTVAPAIREAQAAGAKSLRQIAAALNGRGIATARGGKWEAATVANVLRRVG